MTTPILSAHVESLWVRFRSGTAYSAHVTLKGGVTSELRGAQMWLLLNELSQRWKQPAMTGPVSSLATSARYAKEKDESGPQTTWTWAAG